MKTIAIVTTLILSSLTVLWAGSPPPPPPPPLGIPIDAGAIALLSIAAAYSGVQLYGRKKNASNIEDEIEETQEF